MTRAAPLTLALLLATGCGPTPSGDDSGSPDTDLGTTADLAGNDPSNSDLSGADLKGADLDAANSDLTGSDLTGADLAGLAADLAGSSTDFAGSSTDFAGSNSDLGSTSSDLGSTNSDLGSTSSDLGSTNSDLGSTSSDLGSTTSDLGSTSSDLGSTTSDLGSTNSDLSSNSDLGGGNDGGNVTVAVTPKRITVVSAATTTFTATVGGTATPTVVWSIQEGGAGGSIDQSGVYRAPNATVPASYHVMATSVADPTRSDVAIVDVIPLVVVTVDPASITISPGETATFRATITGAANTAVVWGLREGASAGTIDQTGTYRPSSQLYATWHVVATSVADPAKSTEATVRVVPLISVSLCPARAILRPGESLAFTATVNGAMDSSVRWRLGGDTKPGDPNPPPSCGTVSASGVYTAPATASVCTFADLIVESVEDSRRVAHAWIDIAADAAFFSGTVAYTGTRSGRIYVSVEPISSFSAQGESESSGTTSIAAAGAFTIRGLRLPTPSTPPTTLRARAWMDTLGIGQYLPTADPFAEVTFQASGFGGVITLIDPTPATPPAGTPPKVHPFATGMLVETSVPRDTNGRALIDHLEVYVGDASTPNPTAATALRTRRVVAGGEVVLIEPLAAGSYHVAFAGVAGGVVGVPSAGVPAQLSTTPPPGATVSGTVRFDEHPPGAPLYVAAYSRSNGIRVTRIASPVSPQAFTIAGVPDGDYMAGAILDAGADGVLGVGDPSTFPPLGAPLPVTIQGAAVAGLSITIPSGRGIAFATVSHRQYMSNGMSYENTSLDLIASPLTHGIQRATLITRRDVALAAKDLLLGSDHDSLWVYREPGQPPPGERFGLQVLYSDGVTCNLSATAGSPLPLPTGLLPSGTSTGSRPTFSWSALTPAPSGPYYWMVEVRSTPSGAPSGHVWESLPLPSTRTSIAYNADGSATLADLPSGSYEWHLRAEDQAHNRAEAQAAFTVP